MRSRQSFTDLARWLADCRALASPHLVTVLVGNKLDREEEREVEYVEGSRWAQENGTSPRNQARIVCSSANPQAFCLSKYPL